MANSISPFSLILVQSDKGQGFHLGEADDLDAVAHETGVSHLGEADIIDAFADGTAFQHLREADVQGIGVVRKIEGGNH